MEAEATATGMYKPPLKVLLSTAVLTWIAIALFNTGIFVFNPEVEELVPEFFYAIRWTLFYQSPWLIIVPVIFFLARKFQLNKKISFKNFFAHLVLALIIVFLSAVIHTYFISIRANTHLELGNIAGNFFFYSADRLLIYFVILLGYYAIDYYRKQNEESFRALQLRETISRQNFNSFKNDIQPHFLLKTLKDIEGLVPTRPVLAEQLIADLAQVIRKMLINSQKSTIRPEDDLQFLKAYVSVLSVRINKTINVRKAIKSEGQTSHSSLLFTPDASPDINSKSETTNLPRLGYNDRSVNYTSEIDQETDKRRDFAISLFVINIIEDLLDKDQQILRNFNTILYELYNQKHLQKISVQLKQLSPNSDADFTGWIQKKEKDLQKSFKLRPEKQTAQLDYADDGTLTFSINFPDRFS